MPVVIIPAASVGLRLSESPELDSDTELLRRIESIRSQAGKAMALAMSVPWLFYACTYFPQQHGGTPRCYFTPHSCQYKALAITGANAIASSSVIDGTVTRSPRRPRLWQYNY